MRKATDVVAVHLRAKFRVVDDDFQFEVFAASERESIDPDVGGVVIRGRAAGENDDAIGEDGHELIGDASRALLESNPEARRVFGTMGFDCDRCDRLEFEVLDERHFGGRLNDLGEKNQY